MLLGTAKLAAVKLVLMLLNSERVACVACYFCRNNSCVQALFGTIRNTVKAPNASIVVKLIKELSR